MIQSDLQFSLHHCRARRRGQAGENVCCFLQTAIVSSDSWNSTGNIWKPKTTEMFLCWNRKYEMHYFQVSVEFVIIRKAFLNISWFLWYVRCGALGHVIATVVLHSDDSQHCRVGVCSAIRFVLCSEVKPAIPLFSPQNAQRLGASQVTQPLTTPVVSVATPSLLTPFSMPTAYNTGKRVTTWTHDGIEQEEIRA